MDLQQTQSAHVNASKDNEISKLKTEIEKKSKIIEEEKKKIQDIKVQMKTMEGDKADLKKQKVRFDFEYGMWIEN